MEHEGDDYTICTVTKGLVQGLENNGAGGDCPNYSLIEVGQNTEKSPDDLKRLAVTQTQVKNHQLMPM